MKIFIGGDTSRKDYIDIPGFAFHFRMDSGVSPSFANNDHGAFTYALDVSSLVSSTSYNNIRLIQSGSSILPEHISNSFLRFRPYPLYENHFTVGESPFMKFDQQLPITEFTVFFVVGNVPNQNISSALDPSNTIMYDVNNGFYTHLNNNSSAGADKDVVGFSDGSSDYVSRNVVGSAKTVVSLTKYPPANGSIKIGTSNTVRSTNGGFPLSGNVGDVYIGWNPSSGTKSGVYDRPYFDLYDIIFYERGLGEAEVISVEKYLASNNGITKVSTINKSNNIVAHYNASSLTIGNGITSLKNKLARGGFLPTLEYYNPLGSAPTVAGVNGNNFIRFNFSSRLTDSLESTSQYNIKNSIGNGSYTLFFVISNFISAPANDIIISSDNIKIKYITAPGYGVGSLKEFVVVDTAAGYGIFCSDPTYEAIMIMAVSYDTSALTFRVYNRDKNVYLTNSVDMANNDNQQFSFGADVNTQSGQCDFGDVIIYKEALDHDDIIDIQRELITKYDAKKYYLDPASVSGYLFQFELLDSQIDRVTQTYNYSVIGKWHSNDLTNYADGASTSAPFVGYDEPLNGSIMFARFDGDKYIDISAYGTSLNSIQVCFIVYSLATNGGGSKWILESDGFGMAHTYSGTPNFHVRYDSNDVLEYAFQLRNNLALVTYNKSSQHVWDNLTRYSPNSTTYDPSVGGGTPYIGTDRTASHFADIAILDIITYTSALGGADIKRIQNHLINKYGIIVEP